MAHEFDRHIPKGILDAVPFTLQPEPGAMSLRLGPEGLEKGKVTPVELLGGRRKDDIPDKLKNLVEIYRREKPQPLGY